MSTAAAAVVAVEVPEVPPSGELTRQPKKGTRDISTAFFGCLLSRTRMD